MNCFLTSLILLTISFCGNVLAQNNLTNSIFRPQNIISIPGEITFDPTQEHSLKGDVVFTENAHAVINIVAVRGVDGVAEETFKLVIDEVAGFPIIFTLQLDPVQAFPVGAYTTIFAEVNMGEGSNYYVGDFVTDINIPIRAVGNEFLSIPVTRLEPCGSEGSGGICSTNQRQKPN